MERVLEREIMDGEEQAIAYAGADFSSSNQMFVDSLMEDYSARLQNVLDIGCGPADVPIRLARAQPLIRITAVDASDAMVRLARKAVEEAGLKEQIQVMEGRIPGLAAGNGRYDGMISKDVLHHLPKPGLFWDELKTLAKGDTAIYVMDLFRPPTRRAARNFVESVSAEEPPVLKQDFYNSLLAAFTVDEVKEQLRNAGLALEVARVSDRHLVVKGLIKGAD
jgi:2-polyprenyl-3-methyl-5-hydroxy-6-metoxy-1,4-benzoquinol methylase